MVSRAGISTSGALGGQMGPDSWFSQVKGGQAIEPCAPCALQSWMSLLRPSANL